MDSLKYQAGRLTFQVGEQLLLGIRLSIMFFLEPKWRALSAVK
jgi:hypothetical protein